MSQSEIFRAEKLPVLQNRMFNTAQEALNSPTGDIVLVQDMDTGLVFNAAFDPAKLEYDKSYQNEQACSNVFQSHLNAVTEIIHRNFDRCSLIEVGCGKGYFLDHLYAHGFEITGIDPAYEGGNPRVVKALFKRELGLSADGIILRHVLEHIPDPFAFLSSIADANGGKGIIYIEIPCFDWICHHKAWFDIFYEHVNYFRINDFHKMFGTVLESGHCFNGQYIYVVADLATLRKPCFDRLSIMDFPKDFLDDIHQVAAVARGNKRNAIWGGASKGVIFSIYMQRMGIGIDLVIDINPAKQGKYLACSGLCVMSPLQAMAVLQPKECIFVMNGNYLDEIVAQSGNQYQYYKVDHE